jgi:Holliday junction resolvase RusA-like endonuclease
MSKLIATYTMTMPTTNNHVRASYKGRLITSKAYRIWQQNTLIDLFIQKKHATITHDIFLSIKLSPKTKNKTDIDNRNKGIFDALVASGIIQDDSQVKKLLIEFDYTKKDFVSVEIYEYA